MRFVSRVILVALLALAGAPSSRAQSAPPPAAGPQDADLQAKLDAVEKRVEEWRKSLHIPGVSMVIVKDDRVIFLKGLGLRDVEHNLPVTPNTQFAIGSSTKAFTAMSVMMSVDDGKIALTDPPRKFLPYFKMRDPETDSKITISDLLCHRSGLSRTDTVWYTGKLSSEEALRLVSEIKPTAKLGEKFQYQNIMFLAAGQCVAAAQNMPWRAFVAKRIFRPLGMNETNTSIRDMVRRKDRALGYTYNEDEKKLELLPYRDLPCVAPAGAINSTAADMAKWLRLMLGEGAFEGKRLVTQNSFAELYKKRITAGAGADYGYGWFLRDWNGHLVVEHGGNIDGFNAQVAMMPDQKLGFVLLTNVSASPIGTYTMDAVWDKLVGAPVSADESASVAPVPPEREAGTYHLEEASVDLTILYKDGKLLVRSARLPETELVPVKGRRYKVAIKGVDGVFCTFRPVKDKPAETELFFEQPGAKLVAKRVTAAVESTYSGPLQDLIGKYKAKAAPVVFEVAVRSGKVCLVVPGQPAYPLTLKGEKDQYALGMLPDTFSFIVHRDSAGKVTGALLKQPPAQGDLELTSDTSTYVPPISVEALVQKLVEVEGGEANLRRHHTMVMHVEALAETQGLRTRSTVYAESPNRRTGVEELYAGKKWIGRVRSYFDGASGGTEPTFAGPSHVVGDALKDLSVGSAMFLELDWKTRFKSAQIVGVDKVAGEDVYVVEFKPESGHSVVDYISQKRFLVLRRRTQSAVPQVGVLELTETFEDYRRVDGVVFPFRTVTVSPMSGDTVQTIKSIKFDVKLPDTVFQPSIPKEPAGTAAG